MLLSPIFEFMPRAIRAQAVIVKEEVHQLGFLLFTCVLKVRAARPYLLVVGGHGFAKL